MLCTFKYWNLTIEYSYLPNKRGDSNKRGGWTFSEELINGEGKNAPNKQGGWTFS